MPTGNADDGASKQNPSRVVPHRKAAPTPKQQTILPKAPPAKKAGVQVYSARNRRNLRNNPTTVADRILDAKQGHPVMEGNEPSPTKQQQQKEHLPTNRTARPSRRSQSSSPQASPVASTPSPAVRRSPRVRHDLEVNDKKGASHAEVAQQPASSKKSAKSSSSSPPLRVSPRLTNPPKRIVIRPHVVEVFQAEAHKPKPVPIAAKKPTSPLKSNIAAPVNAASDNSTDNNTDNSTDNNTDNDANDLDLPTLMSKQTEKAAATDIDKKETSADTKAQKESTEKPEMLPPSQQDPAPTTPLKDQPAKDDSKEQPNEEQPAKDASKDQISKEQPVKDQSTKVVEKEQSTKDDAKDQPIKERQVQEQSATSDSKEPPVQDEPAQHQPVKLQEIKDDAKEQQTPTNVATTSIRYNASLPDSRILVTVDSSREYFLKGCVGYNIMQQIGRAFGTQKDDDTAVPGEAIVEVIADDTIDAGVVAVNPTQIAPPKDDDEKKQALQPTAASPSEKKSSQSDDAQQPPESNTSDPSLKETNHDSVEPTQLIHCYDLPDDQCYHPPKPYRTDEPLQPAITLDRNDQTAIPKDLRHLPLDHKLDVLDRSTGRLLSGDEAVPVRDIATVLQLNAGLEPLVPPPGQPVDQAIPLNIVREARSEPRTTIRAGVRRQDRNRRTLRVGDVVVSTRGSDKGFIGTLVNHLPSGYSSVRKIFTNNVPLQLLLSESLELYDPNNKNHRRRKRKRKASENVAMDNDDELSRVFTEGIKTFFDSERQTPQNSLRSYSEELARVKIESARAKKGTTKDVESKRMLGETLQYLDILVSRTQAEVLHLDNVQQEAIDCAKDFFATDKAAK